MRILSIETSCDDTASAIVEWNGENVSVLAHTLSSQIALHTKWGGVVPALASREHLNNIVPVIEETFSQAHLTKDDIDLIAVTEGPGLMPALIIGVSAAKTLALLWKKPLIGIQHIEGHIYANLIEKKSTENIFPLIALVVSGGHTQIILMKQHFHYTLLGETEDDAVGEAFDKVARMLGLPYPGGPEIGKRADAFRKENKNEVLQQLNKKFPRPMITTNDFNFSFSGLKTAVLYALKKESAETLRNEQFIDSQCYAFQEAIVDVLATKTKKALKLYSPHTFVIAGGVSANVRLREQLATLISNHFPQTTFLTPEFSYSLDNAVMIGVAAAFRYEHMSETQKETLLHTPLTLDPNANLSLQNLSH